MTSKSKSKPKYDFRTCLKKSKVLSAEVLESWLAEHANGDSTEQATRLVKDGLLTEWQAKYLLSGRYRLHLGNYQLLTRIHRDAFGDRFIALHPQLGRTVQVQVLPVELTSNPTQRAEFLKQAGLAGELDHQNLVHVLDIDRQQGRYYLVTEHIDGKSLADEDTARFSPVSIATIVRDAITGLQHAHSHEVVHGNLSLENILLGEDGEVKISQLALSPLVVHAADAPKENVAPKQGDLLAVVRMGHRLVKKAKPSESTRQISKLIFALDTKDSDAFAARLTELSQWIEQQQIEPPAINEITPVAEPIAVVNEEVERRSKHANSEPANRSRPRKHRDRDHSFSNDKPINIGSAALIAGAVGLCGYFAYWALSPAQPENAPQQQIATTGDATTSKQVRSLIPSKSESTQTGSEATNIANVAADEAIEPRPSQPSDRSLVANLNSSTIPPAITEAAVPAASETPSTSAADASGTRSEPTPQTTKEMAAGDVTETALADEKSTAEPEPASSSDKTTSTTKKKQKTKSTFEDDQPASPFDGFPTAIDLPSTDLTDETVLTRINPGSIHLLGLEIISPPGIGKGRTTFDLLRDQSDRQQWALVAKKSSKSKSDLVALFRYDRTSGRLKFRWTKNAAESRIAGYARNCAVKLTLANEKRTLNFRKPLPLPGLKLSRDKPVAQLESAIEWLPDPEMISVELLPFRASGLPKTWLEPAIVKPGTPLAIHFHEAISNRFMWLQLFTEIRNTAKFDLKLMLKHADGTVQPIQRSEDLKKLAELLADAARVAEREYLANVNVVAPQGQKTKFAEYVAKLKSTAKKTKKQTEIATENIAIVENIFDRVIPLRVIFRSDDYQVVLIDTGPPPAKKSSDD